jgi:hypothetical protein
MHVVLETLLHLSFALWGFVLGFLFKAILDKKKASKHCGASKLEKPVWTHKL